MARHFTYFLFACCCLLIHVSKAQQVAFCGEVVPMERDFVSYKLMDVIKGNLRYPGFLPALKARSEQYFPLIIPILQEYHIPEDFKYLPVIESGFTNATSPVGAQGVWQLMPATAATLGLEVSDTRDERNQLLISTRAACKYLQQLYTQLHSWTLAAAAYNCGAGNISRNVRRQGSNDYYQLVLNNETAQYIYKIIAIKQLFESPELYIPGFGYNVFNKTAASSSVFATGQSAGVASSSSDKLFKTIRIDIGRHAKQAKPMVIAIFAARLEQLKDFKDGQLVSVLLLDDLQANGVYIRRNTKISGRGWLVSNRVYVDLGFGNTVILCDSGGSKGVSQAALQSGEEVKLVMT
jgi:membrane-bound lytic murein transglycosylase D